MSDLPGKIVFEPAYRQMDAVRGLDDFDYIWLLWEFSANTSTQELTNSPTHQLKNSPTPHLTVRPPRLGGNTRMGVFATRSPFRPNGLGLSCVRLDHIDDDRRLGPVIHVRGADLMDGTPIYDIKPYVAYADSHPEARCGFVDQSDWKELRVVISDEVAAAFSSEELSALRGILAQDPRPRYHEDGRVYGMPFAGRDVHFVVEDREVRVFLS